MTLPECPEEEIIPDCPESTNLRHHRLRAPAEDGGALVSPPYSCVAPLLAANQSQRHTTDCDLLGRSLVELSSAARHEVIDAAVQYTSSYRCVPCGRKQNTEAVDEPPKIIAAGHQPELFHAGVWFKNFVLADLARIHQAVALNLVIDTDDAKPPWINVPGGSLERPLLKQISFDDPVAMVMPFEERTILNQERFAQFSEAVRHHLQPLESEPLLDQFWPVAVERAQATNNLGAALAQSRHILEESLGLVSLELPQSQVCETDSFRWFVGHVICEAARFAEAYNGALALYREVNHVRSKAHPVPDLEQANDWVETPFWIWSADQPVRRSLFVSREGRRLRLTNRAGWDHSITISFSETSTGEDLVASLQELALSGVKLRSKALATTMWARLAISDLFLHGIGGAKYDQLNDEIIRRFFGIPAPSFFAVSATLRLPIAGIDQQHADRNAIRGLEQQLRELEFQPERHISTQTASLQEVRSVLDAKKQLWQTNVPRGAVSKDRFHKFRQFNKQLEPHVASKRKRLEELLSELRPSVRAIEQLQSREFSFCLFPLDKIRRFLLAIRPSES